MKMWGSMKNIGMALSGTMLVATALLIGCMGETGITIPGATEPAKAGDTVKVHYTGMLEDDTVFDTSIGNEPLQFTIGEGMIIPGFEEAVIGMQAGESDTVNIPEEQAYGPRDDGLIMEVERDDLPEGIEPEVGQQLQMSQADGSPMPVTVIDITEDMVTIDANHPLAGEDLIFEIELVEIV